VIQKMLNKFESARPFREDEAWLLFKIAAGAEAGGWSLLIIGISLKQFVLKGNNIPVLITGQLHGTIFLIYLVAAVGLFPSLGWSRRKAFFAALASVPPYGSLMFEQWAAHQRRRSKIRLHSRLAAYSLILNPVTS
jgi:integral membrane protein